MSWQTFFLTHVYLHVKVRLKDNLEVNMVQKIKQQAESLSGLPQPLVSQAASPVIASRDPTTSDTGYSLGQQWANKVSGNFFALASNAGGVATWTTLGSVSSTFTTITAGTFATSTAATAITLSSGNVFTGTGSNAAVGFTFTPKGAGGMTLTTGTLTLSSGNLVLTSGDATLTAGNLTLTSGNVVLTSGSLTLTLGDATLTNGNLILSTAGKGISIKSGANARIGQTTLVLGTKAVANTSVTANTRVFVSRSSKGASTAVGALEAVINAGVGFTVNSLVPASGAVETNDVSVIDWMLVESA
jgi:hypothetical protein